MVRVLGSTSPWTNEELETLRKLAVQVALAKMTWKQASSRRVCSLGNKTHSRTKYKLREMVKEISLTKVNKMSALVVFSGGQDSTTCLFWALKTFSKVRALSFDYDQRHSCELEAAKTIANGAGVQHEIVKLGPILQGTSPLVNKAVAVGQYASAADLPGGVEPTFVPARNALFLTIAANRAAVHGIRTLVTGVCEADSGGYADCRQNFIDAMRLALSRGIHGTDDGFEILTPLMTMNKAASVRMARSLGGDCWQALAYSHTCYKGETPPCGHCHSCILRARGFEEAGEIDPLITRTQGIAKRKEYDRD